MMDGQRNLIAFPLDDSKKQRCAKCGAAANRHKVMETKEVKEVCGKFAAYLGEDLLRGLGRGHFGNAGVMIGVLKTTDDTWLFAHSGQATHGLFSGKVRAFGRDMKLGTVHEAPSLQAIDPFYIDDHGGTLPFARVQTLAQLPANTNIAGLFCAAPKLIQKALALQKYPDTLSERWVGQAHDSFEDMDTIKSCDRCRKTISLMLCPSA